MTAYTLLTRLGLTFRAIGVAVALYRRVLRGPILNWGATDAEAQAWLPGDELLGRADGVSTRAITIDAPASAVWPWIAQMGPSPPPRVLLPSEVAPPGVGSRMDSERSRAMTAPRPWEAVSPSRRGTIRRAG